MFRKICMMIGLLLVGLSQVGFSSPLQAAEQGRGIPWWVWVLIIVVGGGECDGPSPQRV